MLRYELSFALKPDKLYSFRLDIAINFEAPNHMEGAHEKSVLMSTVGAIFRRLQIDANHIEDVAKIECSDNPEVSGFVLMQYAPDHPDFDWKTN